VSEVKWIPEQEPREQEVRRALVKDSYALKTSTMRLYRRPQTWPSQQRAVDLRVVEPLSREDVFFDKLYTYCRIGDSDAALDLMLDTFDEVIEAGNLIRCAELLKAVDLKKVDLAVALGFLSATTAVKRTLTYRSELMRRVRDRFLLELDTDETDRLLAPFR
jgi:hypothetical protein